MRKSIICAMAILAAPMLANGQVTEPPSTCVQGCGSTPRPVPSDPPPSSAPRPTPRREPAPTAPAAPTAAELAARAAAERARREAAELNDAAVRASNTGDWFAAVALLEQAAAKSPSEGIIRNLANARAELAAVRASGRAASERAQSRILEFAESLSREQPAGGLDFDGGAIPSASGGATATGGLDFTPGAASGQSLGFGSPSAGASVVDARNVPSGLGPGLDNAIAGAFASAPPGVSDRIRKGFQAVMLRDWTVAKAWFEDALLRDPSNPRIRSLIDVVGAAPTERSPQPQGRPAINLADPIAILRKVAEQMSNEEFLRLIR